METLQLSQTNVAPGGPERIAIALNAKFSALMVQVARELKKRKDCILYLYVGSDEGVRKFQPLVKDGVFEAVTNFAAEFDDQLESENLNEDDVFKTARDLEEALNCYYSELIMCRRDVGLGFSLGGFHHPRSPRTVNASYAQIVNAYNVQMQFWRSELISKKVNLVLNGPKELAVVTRALGIPHRLIASTRHKNLHHWAEDEYFEFPNLKKAFKDGYDASMAPADLNQPYFQDTKWRAYLFAEPRAIRFLKRCFELAMRRLYLTYKGDLQENRHYFLDQIKFVWRRDSHMKFLTAPLAAPLSSLKGRRFVFFPLQTEPELSLHGRSPEYFSQLGAIASISRDLPAGVFLAVKETMMGVGRRPPAFYEQIKLLKNVVFLDIDETGLDVVRASDAVVTITGTAGIEAAALGKPVVSLGWHNAYSFLPHVFFVKSEAELRGALSKALRQEFDTNRAIVDGANLLKALTAISFDLTSFDAITPGQIPATAARDVTDALLQSIAAAPLRRNSHAPLFTFSEQCVPL